MNQNRHCGISISKISQFDAMVMLEGMNNLCELRVVGNADFEEGVLEGMIIKDRRVVTATHARSIGILSTPEILGCLAEGLGFSHEVVPNY